ncbi:hypothetical protein OOZ19_03920 [Saccharopolyspora sp. NFXS83]|uniref:esterase/lipase family protein n=1 Tax=Saccharopolyspora sp. NFXS83 TaxID=2993560 RepID=UPI00224A5DAF|nr:hypothetical protein [Saccharopolyspora sp. NFXS83]MCX2729377.1 hypothetical protein [Saccharopolyspora sp. NFXS83]
MSTRRTVAALAALTTVALGAPAHAAGQDVPAPLAGASNPVYFVHGYDGDGARNCEDAWGDAIKHFSEKGWNKGSLKTVGYYEGDTACDTDVASATNGTRIKDIAAKFAHQIYDQHTSKGESIDVVAHSMGGLVTRVALLGSAQGWEGFPKAKLKVGDVVTLGTPHQGVKCGTDCPTDAQWRSMHPDSEFMKVLHAPENRLSESWADGTDWSFASSDQDGTVSGDSAIDEGHHADHKFRYLAGNSPAVTHSGIRTITSGDHDLRYWHASDGQSHDTAQGWAPVETAFHAVHDDGDW